MDVVVEASTFSWAPDGGVTRISREILPRMCELDPNLTLEVLAPNPLRGSLPTHASMRRAAPLNVASWLRPHRIWLRPAHWVMRAAYTTAASDDRSRIWHSTYYTVPFRWRGPIVVTVHDMIFEKFPEMFPRSHSAQEQRQKAQAVRVADRLICVSESTRVDAIQHYGLDPKIAVVIPLASSDVFRVLDDTENQVVPNGLQPALTRPFLLWVGGRHAYKNFQHFVRVFAAWREGADLTVVIVGAPLTKAETNLLTELGLRDRVVPLSGVSDEMLCRLYNNAAAFVYASRYEGFGIPLVEAMACECPVVAARIPTSLEVAGDSAVLFEPGNSDEMMHALATAVADGRDCDRVRRGRERAAGFSWDRTASDTLRIYRQLAGVGDSPTMSP